MRKRKTWSRLIILLVLVGCIGLVLNKRQAVSDWFKLLGYHPNPTIVVFANEDTMTNYSKHLVYVYHTRLDNATMFNQDCKVNYQAIVLGCTVANQGIYIYQVSDPQLDGVEQVTTAYEMLHAAYFRLNPKEKANVDKMVMSTYNLLAPSNPDLVKQYQEYLKTEGAAAVPNEMHSVLATEITNLPPDLESYYSQYFVNRMAVVDFANQYQAVFNSRENQIISDDQQLASMSQQIHTDKTSLSNQYSNISSEQSELNMLKTSDQYASYNAQVPGFNSQVDSYNRLAEQETQLISQYNQLVVERNSIALAENQLVKEISSQPSALSTQ